MALFLVSCNKTGPALPKPPIVDAGPPQNITQPTDTVTLTGTVTATGSKVVAYLWSEVSGPNVPVIASEGSLSTIVSGFVPGTYIFQLMAIDTFGVTGVDTMLLTVQPVAKITLQPTNNAYEFDYSGYGNQDLTNTTTGEFSAVAWTINSTPVLQRGAVRFDFSTLPKKPIKSALLSLYSNPTPSNGNLVTPNAGPDNAFYIQRINSSWGPSNSSWLTQPTTETTNQILIPATTQPSLDIVDVDVTTLVNTMISSGNYGFMIKLQDETILNYNSRIFCSSRYPDATKHPRLVINY